MPSTFAQQEGIAELGWQLLDGALDGDIRFACLRDLVGRRGALVAWRERVVVVTAEVTEQAELELAAPQLVEAEVAGDRGRARAGRRPRAPWCRCR